MIQGQWFEQGSAAYSDAALLLDDNYFQLTTASGVSKVGKPSEIQVSDRLGNVQRKLTFDDGSVFSTTDNDAIDAAWAQKKRSPHVIHKLESKLSFVLVALLVTVALSLSFFKWGVPAISYSIANALPQKTNDIIGAHTFQFLDQYVFEDSAIEKNRQDTIRRHFEQTLLSSFQRDENIEFSLHFRAWNMGGESIPNALALPSGEIILTDKFVELSESQDEIDAVLLHEIGHIANRHSLKMVIQSTIVTTAVMMISGDANAVADMGIGLGSLLLSTNYSRNFESEADQFAFNKMLESGIDPVAFSTIMRRISAYAEDSSNEAPQENASTAAKITDYFLTHPNTEIRAQEAQRYSKCFRQGLKVCEE